MSRLEHDDPHGWCRGGGLGTWISSAVLHFAALTGIGLSIPATPQGAADEATREGGIVLVRRTAGGADYFADEHRGGLALAAYETADSSRVLLPPANAFPPPAAIGPQLPTALAALPSETLDFSANLPSKSGPVGRGPDKGIETQVFGVRGKGSRFVYVFDRSSSMEGAPLLAAKRELIASLQSLQSVHQFQIIFYNQEPQLMPEFRSQSPRMAFADESGKRLAANFIGGIFAHGATDHVQALQKALQMRPDVIFFLTDANEPQLRADDLGKIRRFNQGTSINAIEFGVGPATPHYNFLQQLAAENGGQHTYVDVTRLGR
jgi:hypothetical protein